SVHPGQSQIDDGHVRSYCPRKLESALAIPQRVNGVPGEPEEQRIPLARVVMIVDEKDDHRASIRMVQGPVLPAVIGAAARVRKRGRRANFLAVATSICSKWVFAAGSGTLFFAI